MKYILNIGHKTINGFNLAAQTVYADAAIHFPDVTQTVTASEYQGVPEQTSVLRFESDDSLADVLKKCAELSDVLDQECVALVRHIDGLAFGVIVGANPSGITFDFDYFRM